MSLLIKVIGPEGNIMDEHMKTAEKKGYVWYSYEGTPRAKPYDRTGLNDAYFIEQDKLYHAIILGIFKGPTHDGNDLNENMMPFIPKIYEEYIITNWDKFAFSLKIKNIKQIDSKKIENLYYEKDNKQYNPKIMAAAVYVNFMH